MTVTKKTRIGVLYGGLSGEREVSLRSGSAMAQALRARGYEQVVEIDVGMDLVERIAGEKIEAAFIALHGRFGEDGTIQGLLEMMKIPYTGSGVLGSSVSMDKIVSKQLFERAGIRTPPYVVAYASDSLNDVIERAEMHLKYPMVAKPPSEGSTLGLSIVSRASEIESAQKEALKFESTVLWEEYIPGDELTVGILNDSPLPIVEIVPKSGFYDYRSKYTKGLTEYFCPARIPESAALRATEAAILAFSVVKAESFGRVDIRYSKDVPWVLEVNTIPGMTETSLLPKAAAAAGIPFDEMVEKILLEARLKVGGKEV